MGLITPKNGEHMPDLAVYYLYVRIGGMLLPKSEAILNLRELPSPFGAYGQQKIYRED